MEILLRSTVLQGEKQVLIFLQDDIWHKRLENADDNLTCLQIERFASIQKTGLETLGTTSQHVYFFYLEQKKLEKRKEKLEFLKKKNKGREKWED